MSYIIAFIFIAILVGVVSMLFNIPLWLLIVLVIVIFGGRMLSVLNVTYRSKNLEKIEAHLASTKNNQLNQYILAQKEGTHAEQTEALDQVLLRYTAPLVQGTYKATRAMLHKDTKGALEAAATIPNVLMKNFALAQIEACIGKRTVAGSYQLAKPWMRSMIAAIISYRDGDMLAFKRQKEAALNESAGIQYFSNYYFFERIGEYVKK